METHTAACTATQHTKRQLQLHKPASRQALFIYGWSVPRLTSRDMAPDRALYRPYVCMYVRMYAG
jgi:hypothetical protein